MVAIGSSSGILELFDADSGQLLGFQNESNSDGITHIEVLNAFDLSTKMLNTLYYRFVEIILFWYV